jgi:16S rRNA (cytosine967-C5)-methyltransferase
MSLAGSQQQTFLHLLASLRPHWRQEAGLPARIQMLLAGNRAFGSRDRRLYRELIYTALRYLPWVEPLLDHDPGRAAKTVAWLAADIPATRTFRAALAGDWPPCPPGLAVRAAFLDAAAPLLPEWFRDHCPEAFAPAQTEALLARAPLWLRGQATDLRVATREFDTLGWPWQRSDTLSSAYRLTTEVDVTKSEAYRQGLIEVQDLGSQMILASIGIAPGERWLDACAGAGGKTLQLSRLLGAAGRTDAYDVRPGALAELRTRAKRAGMDTITTLSDAPAGTYDGVLVDAPCSGSGTWRRAPHLKWTTSPAQIEMAAARQRALLLEFSGRVRTGGRLVYATCSLSHRENRDVVAAFLAARSDFFPEPFATTFGFEPHAGGFTILPARHDTDGFFVASLRRR